MGDQGYLEEALKAIKSYIIIWFFLSGFLLIGAYWVAQSFFEFEPKVLAGVFAAVWFIASLIVGSIIAKQVSKPLEALSKAILHVSPSAVPVAAPDMEKLTLGRELIANLTRQVYDFASKNDGLAPVIQQAGDVNIQQLPVGVVGIDIEGNITFANEQTRKYANSSTAIVGKNLFTLFDILFREQTLQDWLKECEHSVVTAQKVWRGIRLNPYGESVQYFDMAVQYHKSSVAGETQAIITLLDQNEVYGAEEKGLSFVALAVHELRTPLTILRGYIEVFEDEVKEGSLRPELAEDVRKMQASAENLTAFVNNILKVAKIEENQLTLKLQEENWSDTLKSIVEALRLRAEVRGKKIVLNIAGSLPTVGIDRISIAEVITNLVDNAIKYSPPDKTLIQISSHLNNENLVETVVKDNGVGVPTTVMPHLFEKFSRNYRNQDQIAGSGLGLFLSKALVNAHGGNIWVKSKEGEGSEFGFTILPFASLSEEERNGINREISRNAHGWIKNHSLSRR